MRKMPPNHPMQQIAQQRRFAVLLNDR